MELFTLVFTPSFTPLLAVSVWACFGSSGSSGLVWTRLCPSRFVPVRLGSLGLGLAHLRSPEFFWARLGHLGSPRFIWGRLASSGFAPGFVRGRLSLFESHRRQAVQQLAWHSSVAAPGLCQAAPNDTKHQASWVTSSSLWQRLKKKHRLGAKKSIAIMHKSRRS